MRVFVEHGEAEVASLIAAVGVPVRHVHVHQPTLDDVFLHFTGREIRESPRRGDVDARPRLAFAAALR